MTTGLGFDVGERVQLLVDAGYWTGSRWPETAFAQPLIVNRRGWRVARVLAKDPNHSHALVVVDRGGRVWRMVDPSCVRAAS